MNEIIKTENTELTMSSKEIADLCGKRHDHVLRDIRNILMGLYGEEETNSGLPEKDMWETFFTKMGWGIDSPKLGNQRIQGVRVSRDNRGFISDIRLDYKHTMTLISGYNVKLRKAIIDKWQQLENEARQAFDPMQALNDPAAMRGLLLNYCEKVIELEHKVSEMTPQVDALKRISASDDTLTMTQASKVLGIKRDILMTKLHADGWVYRQNGSWVAYDRYIKNGCLVYKEASYTDESTELKTIRPYCHLTQKGLSRLAMQYNSMGTAEAA